MNILHIVPYFSPATQFGGPIESVFSLCRALAGNNSSVRVLTTDSNGFGKNLDIDNTQEVQFSKNFSVRYCRRLVQESVSSALIKFLPSYVRWADVVHLTAVYSFPTMPSLFIARQLNKPMVWSPRGSLQRWKGSSKPKIKTIWNKICYLLRPTPLILHVTSEEEAKESQSSLPGIKSVIIPNGVEVPPQVNNVPRDGKLRLGYLGRLDPKKGLENLLRALKKVTVEKNFTSVLTIGGSGNTSYTQTIVNAIKTLGLVSHVTMLGHIEGDEKTKFFENIDILVMPSFTENFGLVVAEALAHSVPVIASQGTPWKRVEEVGCGLWVANDPDSLAEALIHMNQMPLGEMGERGRRWMEQEFSWSQVANKMRLLYEELARSNT